MNEKRSVFEVHKEKIEEHEMMLGPVQGKLAVLLDLLTDSLIVAGKHGIYCKNKKKPDEPSLDMQMIIDGLLQSKEIVQTLMDENRRLKEK
jgi:hypothetical protein